MFEAVGLGADVGGEVRLRRGRGRTGVFAVLLAVAVFEGEFGDAGFVEVAEA